MYSQAEENYLKTIYALESEYGNEVSTNLIAGKIKTKASSVTDMLKKLAVKELVVYKKYQGVYLTELGRLSALKVIRKHRLWECFLVQKLQFNWDEVHEIAEQLEHVKSEVLINKLDAFLRFPKLDPHGDPIPDAQGRMMLNKTKTITDMRIGSAGVFVGVKDSSATFLKYLNKKNLALGDKIRVIDIEPFDNSYHIETKTHRLVITSNVAENLCLKNVK
ncbi:metal-dependent transcriptional regulator [Lutimonas sp.]|uniref:metal-dependent transcriptional regulator n=1 Tax=Lutimonas sp. TaxID=1872403 RepID=UPI003D9B2784